MVNGTEMDSESESSSEELKMGEKSNSSKSSLSLPPSPNPNYGNEGQLQEPFDRDPYAEYRMSMPQPLTSHFVVPRKVPCIVLSPNRDSKHNPLFQVPNAIDSPLDSIMAKISKLSNNSLPLPFSDHGNMIWKQSKSYHEDNLRESVELYDSMKQIVKETEIGVESSFTKSVSQKSSESKGESLKGLSNSGKLSFGIDRILSNSTMDSTVNDESKVPCSSHLARIHGDFHPKYLSHCSDCYLLSRFCYKYSPPRSPATAISQTPTNSSIWNTIPLYDHTSTYIHQSTGYRDAQMGVYTQSPSSNYPGISSIVSCTNNSGGRRKRSWSRAVFSNLQRKGLEKRFQIQKYITKPDRRQLAATLGLTDAQVKVWFQNRRMKWRHTKEGKSGDTNGSSDLNSTTIGTISSGC